MKFHPKFHDLIRSGAKTQTRRPIKGPPKWVPGETYELPEVGVRVLCEAVRSERLSMIGAIGSKGLKREGYTRKDHDPNAFDQFRADWDSFYGEGAFDSNPLVWVYSFKVVTE